MTSAGRRRLQPVFDFLITLVVWTYFTAGFVLLFSPFYLWAGIFSKNRERAFQQLNSRFYRGFFFLVRRLMPGHRWYIQPEVRQIRSSVIVCNHRSYLDSILLISLYEKHNTIVKSRLLDIPFFGRMLQWSGYIPSSAEGRFADMMIQRLERMDAFLADGGNLIVFPEGTRSPNGRLGRLNKGAFKIARSCRAPIEVLFIRNTDRMFRRGSFAFDTRGPNVIRLERVGSIDAAAACETGALPHVMATVREMLKLKNDDGGDA
jgi:1-acyl-sn-glycerol-3-phosphate acyltransferase